MLMFKYRAETTVLHRTGHLMIHSKDFRAWTHDGALTKAFEAFGILNPQNVYISRVGFFGKRRVAVIPGFAVADDKPCESFQNGLCNATQCDKAFPHPQR